MPRLARRCCFSRLQRALGPRRMHWTKKSQMTNANCCANAVWNQVSAPPTRPLMIFPPERHVGSALTRCCAAACVHGQRQRSPIETVDAPDLLVAGRHWFPSRHSWNEKANTVRLQLTRYNRKAIKQVQDVEACKSCWRLAIVERK